MRACVRQVSDGNHVPNFLLLPAIANASGSLGITLVSFAAWLVGVLAVHLVSLFFYSLVAVLNIVLVVMIALLHTLGNVRVRAMVRRLCCCRCKKNPEAVEAAKAV